MRPQRLFKADHGVNHLLMHFRPTILVLPAAVCYDFADTAGPPTLKRLPVQWLTEGFLNLLLMRFQFAKDFPVALPLVPVVIM